MAIKTLPAEPEYEDIVPKEPTFGPESALAHRYCQGKGIELGAAAHNPFNLPGAMNVAPSAADDPDDPEFTDFITYKKHQIENSGRYALIDLVGEAAHIPVPDASQDYVISSHVIEHVPDLISAFLEWNRVLVQGGIIFMIFPKRDEAKLDAMRDITPFSHFIEDFVKERNADTHPFDEIEPRRRGHYHVFTLQSVIDLIEWCNRHLGLNWKIEEVEETDSKIGNGRTVIARYLGPVSQRKVQLDVASTVLSAQGAPEVPSLEAKRRLHMSQDDHPSTVDTTDTDIAEAQQALRERIAVLEGQVAERDTQIRAIYASTSWRLSAPIRWVGTALRIIRRSST